MFNDVVILLSGTEVDRAAVAQAAAVVQPLEARITLLRVLGQPVPAAQYHALDPVSWHMAKVEIEAELQHSLDTLRDAGLDAQAEVLEGGTIDKIVHTMQHSPVDLLVTAEPGEILSQTSYALLSYLDIPLLILKGQRVIPSDPAPGEYKRILVPLDGSPRAEYILPLITYLARVWDAQLILAHIVHKPEMPQRTPLSAEDLELVNRLIQRNHEEAVSYLEQLAERLGVATEIRVVVSDNVAGALHEMIQQGDLDLVALSAHGHSGEARWPYGSVANNLIAFGRVPVLVVQDLPGEYRFEQAQVQRRQARTY